MLQYPPRDIHSPVAMMHLEMQRVAEILRILNEDRGMIFEGGIRNLCECFGSLRAHMNYIGNMMEVSPNEFDTAFEQKQLEINRESIYTKIIKDLKSTLTRSELMQKFGKYYENGNWIELGIRNGDGVMKMLQCGAGRVWGVDIWKDDGTVGSNDLAFKQTELDKIKEQCFKRFLRHGLVHIIEGYTHDVVNGFDDVYFDVIYIDADHTYEGIKRDLLDWWPKLKIGGVFSGHDYCNNKIKNEAQQVVEFGVVQAVDEFIKEKGIQNLHVTAEGTASWVIVKEHT